MSSVENLFGQTRGVFSGYLSESSSLERYSLFFAVGWWIGGILEDAFLMLIGATFTTITCILIVIKLIGDDSLKERIHILFFRRAIFGLLALWAYTGGNGGPETVDFFGTEIPVIDFTFVQIAFFILVWFSSRYLDQLRD